MRNDSFRLLRDSLIRNTPLLIYFSAWVCMGLCIGMWSALTFFYVDGYLGLGDKMAIMFLVGSAVAGFGTPLWLKVIHKTSKSRVWAIGIAAFIVQLVIMGLLSPGCTWWLPFGCVVLAHVCFGCCDVAAFALLGDIADYGKLKFRRDRGATYFGLNTLLYKVGIGIGAGAGLASAGLSGFDPTQALHNPTAVWGLKLGFSILPTCFAVPSFYMILRTPISRQRHEIIRRRLESRASRAERQMSGASPTPLSEREAHVGT
jgi:GPH family glycoside/pentoside/hexuronide:cation symporter